MVAKEYECEIPQNPGPYDNKVNDNNNNTKKNITTAMKIDLLNHISNRDTIKICMFKCRGKIFTRELIFTTYHKKNLIMFM